MAKFLEKIGRGVGKVVGELYQAGRDSVDQVIKNVYRSCFHFHDHWYHQCYRRWDFFGKYAGAACFQPDWFGCDVPDRWFPNPFTLIGSGCSDRADYWHSLGNLNWAGHNSPSNGSSGFVRDQSPGCCDSSRSLISG